MSVTPEQYEKISRFLNAEMELAEMDAFEKELKLNPEMRYQLDFEQSLRNDFALQNITRLPGTASAKYAVSSEIPIKKRIGMRKWPAIAAAVIAISILVTALWQKPSKTEDVAGSSYSDTARVITNQPETAAAVSAKDYSDTSGLTRLFNRYFKIDALPEQYPLFLAEALMGYESGNYITLQKLNLEDLPQTRGAGGTDTKENILKWGHYYKGLSFLQSNNTEEAGINLDWVLKHQPGKALKAKAQWYLALTYLKENKKEKAVELCRSIIQNKENRELIKNAEKILDVIEG